MGSSPPPSDVLQVIEGDGQTSANSDAIGCPLTSSLASSPASPFANLTSLLHDSTSAGRAFSVSNELPSSTSSWLKSQRPLSDHAFSISDISTLSTQHPLARRMYSSDSAIDNLGHNIPDDEACAENLEVNEPSMRQGSPKGGLISIRTSETSHSSSPGETSFGPFSDAESEHSFHRDVPTSSTSSTTMLDCSQASVSKNQLVNEYASSRAIDAADDTESSYMEGEEQAGVAPTTSSDACYEDENLSTSSELASGGVITLNEQDASNGTAHDHGVGCNDEGVIVQGNEDESDFNEGDNDANALVENGELENYPGENNGNGETILNGDEGEDNRGANNDNRDAIPEAGDSGNVVDRSNDNRDESDEYDTELDAKAENSYVNRSSLHRKCAVDEITHHPELDSACHGQTRDQWTIKNQKSVNITEPNQKELRCPKLESSSTHLTLSFASDYDPPHNALLLHESCTKQNNALLSVLDFSPLDVSPKDRSLLAQLDRAKSIIQHLQLSRNAMCSSIDTLKTLVANEHAITRATKRQLYDTDRRLQSAESKTPQIDIDDLRKRLSDTEAKLDKANQNFDHLSIEMRRSQEQLGINKDEQSRLRASNSSLHKETQDANLKMTNLIAQLRRRDQVNCLLAAHLKIESFKANHLSSEADALRQKVKSFGSIISERDELLKKMTSLEQQLEARINENCDSISGKNAQVEELLQKLKERDVQLSRAKGAVEQADSLQRRIKELERDAELKDLKCSESRDGESVASLSKNELRKRTKEIKIARAVIAAKDKMLAEMREAADETERQLRDVTVTHKSTAAHVSELSDKLQVAESKLADSNRHLSRSEESRMETKSEVECLEQSLADTKNRLSVAESRVTELEGKINTGTGSREDVERRLQSYANEKDKAVVEARQLKESLDAVRREFSKVRNEVHRSTSSPEEFGLTSPCSDVSSNAKLKSAKSDRSLLQSLADLEAAANNSPCDGLDNNLTASSRSTPAGCSYDQPLSSHQFNNLRSSTDMQDVQDDNLSKTQARVAALQEALEGTERDMGNKIRECQAMENYIEDVLTPALQDANNELKYKTKELDEVQSEFDAHKDLAEQTHAVLKENLYNSDKRLDETFAILEHTREKLDFAETQAACFEGLVGDLNDERESYLQLVDQLRQDREHRQKALVFLRTRLVEVETLVGRSQQQVSELGNENERLEILVGEEQERRKTAEYRASQKDLLLYTLEDQRIKQTEEHSTLVAQAQETSKLLSSLRYQFHDLENALELNKTALQKQAQTAGDQDEIHWQARSQLEDKLKQCQKERKSLQDDLASVQERSETMSLTLASSSERLHALENELTQLKDRHADNETQLKRKNEKVRLLEHNLSIFNATSDKNRTEIARLNKNLASTKAVQNEKEHSIATLCNEKAILEKSVSDVRALLVSERSKCESLETKVASLESDIEAIGANLKKSEGLLKERVSDAEALSRCLVDAQTRADHTKSLLDKSTEQKVHYEESSRIMKSALNKKETELDFLKSHLEDHDALINDYNEKEKLLAVKVEELSHAKSYMSHADKRLEQLSVELELAEDNVNQRDKSLEALQAEKEKIERDLTHAHDAISSAETAWNSDRAEFESLVHDLEQTVAKRDSDIQSLVEFKTRVKDENKNLEEQLLESNANRDQLLTRLTCSEKELAELKENTSSLNDRVRDLNTTLAEREQEVKILEERVACANQSAIDAIEKHALGHEARCRETDVSHEALKKKDSAISKLRRWSHHLSAKLRTTEKNLIARDADLEVCNEMLQRLESRMNESNRNLHGKESKIKEMKSRHELETARLQSRIDTLRGALKDMQHSDTISSGKLSNSEHGLSTDVLDEISELKARLRLREMDVTEARARNGVLENCIAGYERDVMRAQKEVDGLKAEVEKLENQAAYGDWERQSDNGGMFSVTELMLKELRRSKDEVRIVRDAALRWQMKAEAWQPFERDERPTASTSVIKQHALWNGKGYFEAVESSRLMGTRNDHNTAVCTVTFRLHMQGTEGPGTNVRVYIVGGDVTLGQWNYERKIALTIIEVCGGKIVRGCQAVVPAVLKTDYKYVADCKDGQYWETGANRELQLEGQLMYNVNDEWRGPMLVVPPVYVRTKSETAQQLTSQTLRQLQSLQNETQHSHRETNQVLHINRATDAELVQTLTPVYGLGVLSINRIMTERSLHGDFLGEQDFNRRVVRLTFAKLKRLCSAKDLVISFEPKRDGWYSNVMDYSSVSTACTASVHLVPVTPLSELGVEEKGPKTKEVSTIEMRNLDVNDRALVIATWNAARLSTRGRAFDEKLRHLCTFLNDSRAQLVAIQEVSADALTHIMERIPESTALPWALFKSDQANSVNSLAIIYRQDRVHLTLIDTPKSADAFVRRPQIVLVTPLFNDSDDDVASVVIVHVHISHSRPRPELGALAHIVQDAMKTAMEVTGERSCMFPMVLGDFNMNSDAQSFHPLIEIGLVELVRPPCDRTVPHTFRTLDSHTTVGGQWYDNVWIHHQARWRVQDAWGFRFAVRTRALSQSSYAYAADRRARSSDHTPLVVKLDLSPATSHNDALPK